MTSKKSGCGCLPILGIGLALKLGGLYFFNGKELNMGLGAAIALETSEATIAKASLDKIENVIQQNSPITPSLATRSGKTITEWRIPDSNFTWTYNWIDNNSLLFTLGDSVMDNIENISITSFNKSSNFKAIANELPKKNLGFLYLNMSSTSEIINRLPFKAKSDISLEIIELLDSMAGIGATASMPKKSQPKVDLLVRFK
ncbi:MAG TPA: DUF3352 domain-containing protein [Coleofasciculaceae cyanobacterium]|jgi:hypothetical protein